MFARWLIRMSQLVTSNIFLSFPFIYGIKWSREDCLCSGKEIKYDSWHYKPIHSMVDLMRFVIKH